MQNSNMDAHGQRSNGQKWNMNVGSTGVSQIKCNTQDKLKVLEGRKKLGYDKCPYLIALNPREWIATVFIPSR